MNREQRLFYSPFVVPLPVAWDSAWVGAHTISGVNVSVQIEWRDVAATFRIDRSNSYQNPVPDDITIWYRTIDVAWVDPVLGDPLTEHVVSINNLGARFFRIGFTAANWAGANHYMRITFSRNRNY